MVQAMPFPEIQHCTAAREVDPPEGYNPERRAIEVCYDGYQTVMYVFYKRFKQAGR